MHRFLPQCPTLLALACAAVLGCARSEAAGPDILLVNTRACHCQSQEDLVAAGLPCERCEIDPQTGLQWHDVPWNEAILVDDPAKPTIIFIHGNRVARGNDREIGILVLRVLRNKVAPLDDFRYVIWSWPSAKIPGVLRDYQLKAERTRPAALRLAWFLDELPAESPVSIIGYSYGARIASGAMHLLDGGSLEGLRLSERANSQRRVESATLVAPALDADWLEPGGYHGGALSRVDNLVLLTNYRDPAMRFYHLSTEGRRTRALGWQGVADPDRLGNLAPRVQRFDVTEAVGRSHALGGYLSAAMARPPVWEGLGHMFPRPAEATHNAVADN